MPENIFNKIMLYLSHPIADIFKERCNCLIEKIKDVPELAFHRVYFYTRSYPELFAYIKDNPRKQIHEIYFKKYVFCSKNKYLYYNKDFRNKCMSPYKKLFHLFFTRS